MSHYFVRVEKTVTLISVDIDDEIKATARASVGPLSDVVRKEGVEVVGVKESSETLAVPAQLVDIIKGNM